MLYGMKTLLGIEAMNALPDLLFSDEAAMRLAGFNAMQIRQGICQRSHEKRQGAKPPGPLCLDTLADNIVKLSLTAMEAFLNGVVQDLAKAGVFVFGSGLAVVPFLYGGVVQEHHWLTDRQFVDAVAVAMITPGPVVITVAFIGYLVAGISGATAAALGIFFPVYLIVVLLAPSYKRWAKNPQLNAFVRGVTAAATGAIAGAVIVLARRSIYDVATLVIALVTLGILIRWKVPEPILIACAAVAGLLLRST